MKGKILIVEDHFIEANNLQMILERAGYQVCEIAPSVAMALKIVEREQPNLVLLDIFLRGSLTGIHLAVMLKEKNIAFIYLSANSDKQVLEAAKATRPYGFLVKPFREKDVLVMLEIAHHLHEHSLESMIRKEKNCRDRKKGRTQINTGDLINPSITTGNFHGIIGNSKKLQQVLDHLQLVAPSDTSVLVLGESGTGKERIAECVHELSPRNKKPLIKVNCAALPSSLIESVLFGHERGSYTGATERRIGKFEQAQGGTIFLDEIGEMPIEIQVKLLRVLQEKEIERIGSNDVLKIDVRIIAATNRNLEKEISAGKFRMDLYYRLNVFPLTLPALKDRKEDIPLLVRHFLDKFSEKMGKNIEPLSNDLLCELMNQSWPGNIRELAHTIERMVLLSQGSKIKNVMPPAKLAQHEEISNIKTMEQNDREYVIYVLKKCRGKIFGKGGAAELLGVPPSTLNSRIKKLGIEKETLFKTSFG